MELDEKATLLRYLRTAREALLWKLDGLSEYDIRRPLTATGTNFLGVVKHLAMVELGYFGDIFGRPANEPQPWDGREPETNEDMFATADESRADIIGRYERAAAHSDATIEALDLDHKGHVPWWPPEVNEPTLHRILVHMIAETNRHLGHVDVLREGLDGMNGLREDVTNMPELDADGWADYVMRVEAEAIKASGE